MKILMVCLGNICRSPLADGIMRQKLNHPNITKNGIKTTVDSCGTAGYHIGEAPDARMIATAKKRGLDISGLRARQFKVSDFDTFDRIHVMDKSNLKNVLSLARNSVDENKVSLLLSHSNSAYTEVPDPYYDDQEGFDLVYDLVEEACENIARQLYG